MWDAGVVSGETANDGKPCEYISGSCGGAGGAAGAAWMPTGFANPLGSSDLADMPVISDACKVYY